MAIGLPDNMRRSGAHRMMGAPVASDAGYSLTGGQQNFMQPAVTPQQAMNPQVQAAQMATQGGQPAGQFGATMSGGGGGFTQVHPLTGQPMTGQMGFENAIMSQTDNALAALRGMRGEAVSGINQATQSGMGSIQGGVDKATGFLNQGIQGFNPMAQEGTGASSIQAALAGALGPEAQAQALQNLQPVNAFLQEQGDRAVTRNAAALGGLGGGNVLKELTRFGQGLAGQSAQQQFQNLGTIAERGFGALQNIGNLRGQQGQIAYQGGRDIADIGSRGAEAMANARMQAGGQIANVFGQAGSQIGQARLGTGQQLASAIGSTTSALSNLQNQQGQGVSGQISAGGGNLANLLAGVGGQMGQADMNLAQLLANLASGSAGQVAGLPGIPGTQQTGGILGGIGQAAGGIGTMIGALNPAGMAAKAATGGLMGIV